MPDNVVDITIIELGEQGPAGPPGLSALLPGGLPGQVMIKQTEDDGDVSWEFPSSVRNAYVAGESIVGYRSVKLNNSLVYHCSGTQATDSDECIGISVQSANTGDDVTVVFSGEVTEPTWNWTNGPVYVGASGSLTQSVSGLAFIQQVATATAPTKIIVDTKLSVLTAA